jgi:hypothetical protein
MSTETVQSPILTAYNTHIDEGHAAPVFVDQGQVELYIGYFVSGLGDQWIYTYDYVTQRATLRGGDLGWGDAVEVMNGRAPELVLNEAEQLWVRACWTASQEAKDVRVERAQAKQRQ